MIVSILFILCSLMGDHIPALCYLDMFGQAGNRLTNIKFMKSHKVIIIGS